MCYEVTMFRYLRKMYNSPAMISLFSLEDVSAGLISPTPSAWSQPCAAEAVVDAAIKKAAQKTTTVAVGRHIRSKRPPDQDAGEWRDRGDKLYRN